MHKREKAAFENAVLRSLGKGLKKIYLQKWYGQPETTAEIARHCADVKVHLDLSYANARDVASHTMSAAHKLVELKLLRDPNVGTIAAAHVSPACLLFTTLMRLDGGQRQELQAFGEL